MRNVRFSGLFTVMATLVVAMTFVLANCGGGGGSPTEPPPKPTPVPTNPVPVTPSITFDSSIPACGTVLNSGERIDIYFTATVNPGTYTASATLLDAQGKLVPSGETGQEFSSSGHYNITETIGVDHFTSATVVLYMTGTELNPPVQSPTVSCRFSR